MKGRLESALRQVSQVLKPFPPHPFFPGELVLSQPLLPWEHKSLTLGSFSAPAKSGWSVKKLVNPVLSLSVSCGKRRQRILLSRPTIPDLSSGNLSILFHNSLERELSLVLCTVSHRLEKLINVTKYFDLLKNI